MTNILACTKQLTVNLTIREKEIIILICNGLTSPAIAEKLFISINTVKGHRKNIFKKLNIKNVLELIVFAISHDFLNSI
jgi:DNA-binding CsgD family transcriptional regulator